MTINPKKIRVFTIGELKEEALLGAVSVAQYSIIKSLENEKYDVIRIPISLEKKGKISSIKKVIKGFSDLINIKDNTKTLFFYPSIPFIPLTSNIKIFISYILYFIFFTVSKIKKHESIMMILDLPVEQDRGLFQNDLKVHKFLYDRFEKFLLKNIEYIVVFSDFFKESISAKVDKKEIYLAHALPYTSNINGVSFGENDENLHAFLNRHNTIGFYSGDLRRGNDKKKLLELFRGIEEEEFGLIICGLGGQWIEELGINNVFYCGNLPLNKHDFLANKSDFGILIYPKKGYYNWTPTTKYSAYMANGLPILAINSLTIEKNIETRKVGESVPSEVFLTKLIEWGNKEDLKKVYGKGLSEEKFIINSGLEIKEIINKIYTET